MLADPERAVTLCRQTHRLTPVALSVDIEAPEPDYYHQFAACCRLAKAIKVVTITVRSAELGTPFNAEVERLRTMVALAAREGVRVGLLTEVGRMTENPDTAVVMCDSVKGLGITLDPSHYIYGPHGGVNFEQVMKHVYHVRLRDTTKDQLQVRVGQGDVEYGRLVNQLNKVRYDRALCVDMLPMPDVDQLTEMRKMRLLLESLLVEPACGFAPSMPRKTNAEGRLRNADAVPLGNRSGELRRQARLSVACSLRTSPLGVTFAACRLLGRGPSCEFLDRLQQLVDPAVHLVQPLLRDRRRTLAGRRRRQVDVDEGLQLRRRCPSARGRASARRAAERRPAACRVPSRSLPISRRRV